MSEQYKLGISRNRLFEPENTVVFCGRYKEEISEAELQKALKMLSVKEPVITSCIQVDENADAYICTQQVEPAAVFSQLSVNEIIANYRKTPLLFYNKLFEFMVSCDGFLVVAGHTTVCDSKSMLRIAKHISGYLGKKNLSVEPEKIYTFSEKGSLPIDVVSPLVNKLSSELDDDWRKERRSYTVEDYKKLSAKYLEQVSDVSSVKCYLNSEKVRSMKRYCEETEVDFSSFVYFCFYKALREFVKIDKKSSKMRLYADRRFFHGKEDVFSVGPYNGTVCVSLSAKELRKTREEQLKVFHLDTYRALTSPFRVFSDEILLANVQKDFCDSSYVYMMGGNKLKSSKNLAQTYGCMNKELCECFYCNLQQMYWYELQDFSDICVYEPFKSARSDFSLTFIDDSKGANVELRFNATEVDRNIAEKIFNRALKYMDDFKK